LNTRIRGLAADLMEHITQTNNDVVAVRQEMAELGEQISGMMTDGVKTVSDNITECRNQILAEKESNVLKFQKVNQEIEILKARLASKQASENLSASKGNNEQNQVANVNSASQNTITPSESVSKINVSHNVSTCIDVANVELFHVNNTAVVDANSEMPINCNSLSELSLPSFLGCNKQLVVTFMQDLDMYFELKKVSENLKLPLLLHTINDPFAQNWVSSEYHKIDSYQSFKYQFSKLFWNELPQSRVCCDIYQGKYNLKGGESMTEHYV
jgi:hypothetical protein